MAKKQVKETKKKETKVRSYSNRGDSSLAKFISSNGQVYGTLTLDTRRLLEDGRYPVAVRVAFDGKSKYLRIGKTYSMEEWVELCECEKQGRNKKAMERMSLKNSMSTIEESVNVLLADDKFTLARLVEVHSGKTSDKSTIYSIWEEYMQSKLSEGKAGSARCNKDVYKRFIKDMGTEVSLADIDKAFVQEWVKRMKKAGLGITTIAIGLRSFRTIVNICISRGLVKGDTKEMFKDSGYNKSQSRKHEFLDTATMRMLYDFWKKDEAVDENGDELYMQREKQAIFRDLGLFLFMYLGDGQNLADTLRLTYDDWYYSTHGKQMRFLRHKTRDRNESASEVIFPVTPELKAILDKYGNEPKLGRRVFPIMSDEITPEQEVWVIQRYNRYIREHMKKVADMLGMEQKPSPTWARHSFATNLNNSGVVPYKYISDSMGHSGNGDITSNYIGAYPLAKMLEYNHYLLNSKPPKAKSKKADNKQLIEMLMGLSEEEKKAIVAALSQ